MSKIEKEPTPFTRAVIAWIRRIPRGSVATYGQIAGLAGKPGAARGVVWILHSSSGARALPWHRVLNAQGKISFAIGSQAFREQRRLLRAEGIEVDREGRLELARWRWRQQPSRARRSRGPRLFST